LVGRYPVLRRLLHQLLHLRRPLWLHLHLWLRQQQWLLLQWHLRLHLWRPPGLPGLLLPLQRLLRLWPHLRRQLRLLLRLPLT